MPKTEGWSLYRRSPHFVEAICPHGVGHHKGVHGCHMSKKTYGHGCCYDAPEELWSTVTKDSE